MLCLDFESGFLWRNDKGGGGGGGVIRCIVVNVRGQSSTVIQVRLYIYYTRLYIDYTRRGPSGVRPLLPLN